MEYRSQQSKGAACLDCFDWCLNYCTLNWCSLVEWFDT